MTPMRRAGAVALAMAVVTTGAACTATKSPQTAQPNQGRSTPVPTTPGPGVSPSEVTLASYNLYDGNKATFDAVVGAFNQSGGIAGRQVKVVPLPTGKAADNASQAVADQASCLAIAEYKGGIFAVLGEPGDVVLDSCLNDHGTAVVLDSGGPVNQSLFEQAPLTAGLTISYDRAATALVGVLQSSGFLEGARTVAVVSASNTDDEDTVAKNKLPDLLRTAGVSNVSVDIVPSPPGGGGPTTAAVVSTALKIKSQRPDRIIVFGLNVGLGGVISEAVKQHVDAPVATFTSSPFSDLDGFGLASAGQAQLGKSVIVSWNSQFGPKQLVDKRNSTNPAAAACVQVVTAARIPADQARQALPLCEQLDLLRAALSKDGNTSVNAQAFIHGIGSLATFSKFITVYGAGFSAERRDGISASQLMAYSSACKCFVPQGDPEPVR